MRCSSYSSAVEIAAAGIRRSIHQRRDRATGEADVRNDGDRGLSIAAAACIFPVSQRETLDRSLGLRHRAGLGITEESDAIAIVVSQTSGSVRVFKRGKAALELAPRTARRS